MSSSMASRCCRRACIRRAATDFATALEADLARADAFVQLLGRTQAKRPPDMPLGYDRLQFEQAARGFRSCSGCGRRRSGDRRRSASMCFAWASTGLKCRNREAVSKPPPAAAAPGESSSSSSMPTAATSSSPRSRREFGRNLSATSAGLVGGRAARPRREHRRVRRAGDGLRRDGAGLGARPAPPLFQAEAPPQAPLKALALYLGPPESKPDIGMDCRRSEDRLPRGRGGREPAPAPGGIRQ